jgi:parallel beta-helix repeat protein
VEKNDLSGNTVGILLEGSGGTVQRNTLRGNGIGIAGSSDATVEQNIITGCSSYAVGCLGNYPNVHGIIRYNVFWDNAADFASGTCYDYRGPNEVEDPEFCAGGITLHVNSVCAPANNDFGLLVGAKGIACASGDLANSAILTPDIVDPAGMMLVSDFRVLVLDTLELTAGVIVTADGSDEANLGSDNGENEFLVRGLLRVAADPADPVVFRSSLGSPTAGSWYGINTESAYPSHLEIDGAEIRDAQYGVSANRVWPTYEGPSYIRNSTFANNSIYDISLSVVDATLEIEDNVLTVGGGSGLYFAGDGDEAVVQDNEIVGDSTSTSGIKHGVSGSEPWIGGNSIHGFTNGRGIEISAGTPTVVRNTVSDNKYGIYVTGGTPLIGTTDGDSDNFIDDSFDGNLHGIWVQGSGAAPVVRNNRINGNTYGVTKKSSGSPDLGNVSVDGNNDLSGNGTYCIWNQTAVGITAVGNYFGNCDGSGDPPICWSGPILNSDHLCLAPARASQWAVERVPEPKALVTRGMRPNPAAGPSLLLFELGEGGSGSVAIYDVAGRLVREFGEQEYEAGPHELSWDGRDGTGKLLPAGLYFVRLLFEGLPPQTTRVVVAR